MGVSLLVPKDAKEVSVSVRWGDYRPVYDEAAEGAPKPSIPPAPKAWTRTQRSETVTVKLPASQKPTERDVPNSGGLRLALAIRPVRDIPAFELVQQKGTRSVSLFFVNRREPAPDETRDTAFAFQAHICVASEVPFVPRPNLRGLDSTDWDERVADLQYHDACEYAVGHGISTYAPIGPDGHCKQVHSCGVPTAPVERVAPSDIPDVELGMEKLAGLIDGADAAAKFTPRVMHYAMWTKGSRSLRRHW